MQNPQYFQMEIWNSVRNWKFHKNSEIETFHSQTKIVCMSLDAYMEVEKRQEDRR